MINNAPFAQSEQHRERLVTSLRHSGTLRSTAIAQAFAAIPREAFLPHIYERSGGQWLFKTRDTFDQDTWLDLVYQDSALVTSVDQQHIPLSSSSAPSLMASMLEALDIRPGHRVLEIGTGTGYNAALVALLTGDPTLVTTIDLDPQLTDAASRTLQQLVGPVRVETGDGRWGVPGQPYDRIILTASTSALSSAWYQQLAPGGRLIAELEGSLQAGSGLLVQKQEGQAQGRFLGQSWHFMALRSQAETAVLPLLSREHTRSLFAEPPGERVEIGAQETIMGALGEPSFRWFLQWWWPTDALRIAEILVPQAPLLQISDAQQRTILQLKKEGERWSGQHHGTFPLWQSLQQAYENYTLLHPQPEDFEVSWTEDHAFLQLPASTPLRDLSLVMQDACSQKASSVEEKLRPKDD